MKNFLIFDLPIIGGSKIKKFKKFKKYFLNFLNFLIFECALFQIFQKKISKNFSKKNNLAKEKGEKRPSMTPKPPYDPLLKPQYDNTKRPSWYPNIRDCHQKLPYDPYDLKKVETRSENPQWKLFRKKYKSWPRQVVDPLLTQKIRCKRLFTH